MEQTKSAAEVLPVSEKHRVDLLLAFSRKRAADAELRSAQLNVDRIIEKLDKEGHLRAAFQEAAHAAAVAQDADVKMTAVIADVQKEVGHPLIGYHIDSENGNLIKPPAPPPPPAAAEAPKVVDLKSAAKKHKSKK